jgi:hypothetical protein
MPHPLADRASKLQTELQRLPLDTIQQNKQFFDDVWNFCGAVIDAFKEQRGQFVPTEPLM